MEELLAQLDQDEARDWEATWLKGDGFPDWKVEKMLVSSEGHCMTDIDNELIPIVEHS